MSEIKNWPYFQRNRWSPYSGCFSVCDYDYAFVPTAVPCELHATGFDGYVRDCGCDEFKLRKRTDKQKVEIRKLQEFVRRQRILQQADEIRAFEAAEHVESDVADDGWRVTYQHPCVVWNTGEGDGCLIREDRPE